MTPRGLGVLCGLCLFVPSLTALKPDVVRSAGAVPPHIAGTFREPTGFQQAASGQYFVFDRRAHVVHGIDAELSSSWEIVHIGAEAGRIIDPTAFAVEPDGTFVVADAPNGRERIQIFTPAGFRIGGFMLPGRLKTRVVIDNAVLNGIGSLQYTGTSILMSQPETGALVTEYGLTGGATRTFGHLRRTGHEDAAGEFVFERRIQGREIDQFVAGLPAKWPTRRTSEGELPLVTPTIRTAAVDRAGNLWVAFVVPYTYVFDRDGDKVRTVQFRAAGIVTPSSLFFGTNGRVLVTPGLYQFPAQ
jgi:hypothetical protein